MIDLEKYQKLNQSFRRELIFHVGATSGFYSELNNMVLAMAYCLLCRIKFSLYSEDANFKCDEGWNDYFLPFCKEFKGGFYHKYNLRDEDPNFVIRSFWRRLRFLFYRISHRRTFLTYDLFFKFRLVSFDRTSFTIPELGVKNADLRSLSRDIINMIYCFNAETSEAINKCIESLELPKEYIGFHIRGGDKVAEHCLEDCTKFIAKAEKLSHLRVAYVSTDEFDVIQRLRQEYPDWIFYTLTEPTERGFSYQDFVKLSPQNKKEDMIKLFASMEILRNSTVFVGTFSSNLGMFLGMCKERAYGVDFERWLIW